MQYGICIKFIICSKKDDFLVLHFFGRQISWDVMEEGDFFLYCFNKSHSCYTINHLRVRKNVHFKSFNQFQRGYSYQKITWKNPSLVDQSNIKSEVK